MNDAELLKELRDEIAGYAPEDDGYILLRPSKAWRIHDGIERLLREKQECAADHPIEPAWAELLAAGIAWAETMNGDNPAYSTWARRLFRAIAALKEPKP